MFDIFIIIVQNIDCGYMLDRLPEAVLWNTHNLCFRAKIRKNRHTAAYPSFAILKWGTRGVCITRPCCPDGSLWDKVMFSISNLNLQDGIHVI